MHTFNLALGRQRQGITEFEGSLVYRRTKVMQENPISKSKRERERERGKEGSMSNSEIILQAFLRKAKVCFLSSSFCFPLKKKIWKPSAQTSLSIT